MTLQFVKEYAIMAKSMTKEPEGEAKSKKAKLNVELDEKAVALHALAGMQVRKAKLRKVDVDMLTKLAKKGKRWNPGQRGDLDYLQIYASVKAGGINTPPLIEARNGKLHRLLRGYVRADAAMHLKDEHPKLHKRHHGAGIICQVVEGLGDEEALVLARDHGQVVGRPKVVILRELIKMRREGKKEAELVAQCSTDLFAFSKPSAREKLQGRLREGLEVSPETGKPKMSAKDQVEEIFKFHRGTIQFVTRIALKVPKEVEEAYFNHVEGNEGPKLNKSQVEKIAKANKAAVRKDKLTPEAKVAFEDELNAYGMKPEKEFAPLTKTEAEEFVKARINPLTRAVVLRLAMGVKIPDLDEAEAEVTKAIDEGRIKLPAGLVDAVDKADARLAEIEAAKAAKIEAAKAAQQSKE